MENIWRNYKINLSIVLVTKIKCLQCVCTLMELHLPYFSKSRQLNITQKLKFFSKRQKTSTDLQQPRLYFSVVTILDRVSTSRYFSIDGWFRSVQYSERAMIWAFCWPSTYFIIKIYQSKKNILIFSNHKYNILKKMYINLFLVFLARASL